MATVVTRTQFSTTFHINCLFCWDGKYKVKNLDLLKSR